jgi:hypothetical protein
MKKGRSGLGVRVSGQGSWVGLGLRLGVRVRG